ncbi:DUF4062 domain-containing protein [Paenibacillus sp. FSL R10-2199]|uniref:DUF4062 domain-containing protein n=1 Tax=Paenibacillus sp. FSL R10-2199 TaxID=2975348 RepID=UPI0030F58043
MKKKLQVFISSTYIDLIAERQAAVEAVLEAGHIPAGMELFQAGSKSQRDTIQRWIDESDVYLLILGSRYGSIEPLSEKSYTHWEYDYAGDAGKPRFAVYISEEAYEMKAKEGSKFIEQENYTKYQAFKQEVLSHMSRQFNDTKDIKIAVLGAITKIQEEFPYLTGWISGEFEAKYQVLEALRDVLQVENQKLRETKVTPIKKNDHLTYVRELNGRYVPILIHMYKMHLKYPVNIHTIGQELHFHVNEIEKAHKYLLKYSYLARNTINTDTLTERGIRIAEKNINLYELVTKLEKYIMRRLNRAKGENILFLEFKTVFPQLEDYTDVARSVVNLKDDGLICYLENPFFSDNNVITSVNFANISLTLEGTELMQLIDG